MFTRDRSDGPAILGEDLGPDQDPEGRAGAGGELTGAFAPSAERSRLRHALLLPVEACGQESSTSRSLSKYGLGRAGAVSRQPARAHAHVNDRPAENNSC